jgi:hypothetical protein
MLRHGKGAIMSKDNDPRAFELTDEARWKHLAKKGKGVGDVS